MMVKNMVVIVLVVVCGLVLASAEPQFSGGSGGCRPGTVTQQDCNTCRCLPSGGLACTRKACLGGPSSGGGGRPRPIPLPGNSNGNGRFPPNFGGNFNGNGRFPSNFGGFGNVFRVYNASPAACHKYAGFSFHESDKIIPAKKKKNGQNHGTA
ncbi:uncharacterized protein LOC122394233 [Amphibalanus amphitrite]|uniref:uncharacterized protein LOC122394233 n=1 Tax=Amphibalanus amphitrite TaxID=1232801 RepID=UPI001C92248D|nr:uncharacterized protein LOC122394233 [Amphibalanus amphitrite]